MPTIAPISRVSESRMTFIIRSEPMLPEPMIVTCVVGVDVIPRLLRSRR